MNRYVKKTMELCLPGVVIMAGWVHADRIVFTGEGRDSCWTNEANWIYYKSDPLRRGLPTTADEVRLNTNMIARITTSVTISYLKVGANGVGMNGKVIIDGGSLVTIGTSDYNSASQSANGSIIVTNGGTAVFNSRFYAGNKPEGIGTMFIEGGSVRVASTYYHHMEYTGTNTLYTRTTVGEAGLLDVDMLVLNAGVMDIAGGTVIVRMGNVKEINQWIAEKRIVAMGGTDDWRVKVTVDPATGYVVLTAERFITVGMLRSVSPVPPYFDT
jgi:hypothetical protein